MRRYRIPSGSALVAFECAARHCNFRRTAEELHTSQSAISRHVKGLEDYLGTRLFERHGRRLTLSLQGRRYHRAVVSALEELQSAAREIAARGAAGQLLVACSHEISHLFLMPRFEAIQDAVGGDIDIRVLTVEYELQDSLGPEDFDVCFSYRPEGSAHPQLHRLLPEEVRPVCAPSFLARHGELLAGGADGWGGLPLLELNRPNYGWATWADWYQRNGLAPAAASSYHYLDNYVYLLEAAAAGKGLALGWTGLVERYLDSGMLVAVTDRPTRTGGGFFARVSPQSADKPAVREFVDCLVRATDA